MKGAFVTVEIFVFCSWRFSNQFDIVSETRVRSETVGSELWLAILSSLKCFIAGINQCFNSYFETGKSLFYGIN